jgi:hypothetical protein
MVAALPINAFNPAFRKGGVIELPRRMRPVLTAVENGGAGRSKMVALGGVDLP